MKLTTSIRLQGILLFTEMLLLYCLFTVLAFNSTFIAMTFSFPVYAVYGFACMLVHILFFRRERTLGQCVILCVILAAIGQLIMIPFTNVTGFFFRLYTVIIFVYPAIRCYFLNQSQVDANRMVRYTELSMVYIVIHFVSQLGFYKPEFWTNIAWGIVVLVNLITLSLLRIGSAVDENSRERKVQRGFILAAAVTFIIALSCLAGLLFLPEMRQGILALFAGLKGMIFAALAAIERGVRWLFSLFLGFDDGGELPVQGEGMEMSGEELGSAEVSSAVYVALALLAVLVVVAILWLIWKHRKVRLTGSGLKYKSMEIERTGPDFFRKIKELCMKIAAAIRARVKLLSQFHSPAGVYYRLEFRGKRAGYGRNSSQTPRAYLMMLLESNGDKNKAVSEGSPHAIYEFADELDYIIFAGGNVEKRKMSREQEKKILAVVPKRRKGQNATTAN